MDARDMTTGEAEAWRAARDAAAHKAAELARNVFPDIPGMAAVLTYLTAAIRDMSPPAPASPQPVQPPSEAFLAGWNAAIAKAAHELRQRAADPACLEPYGLSLAACVVEAMEPPGPADAQPSMAPFFITETLFRGTHMGYSFSDTCGAMQRVRESKGFATWAEARAAGWDVRACKVQVTPDRGHNP